MSHDNPFESPQSSFDEPSTRRITPYDGEKLNPWYSIWFRPRATIRQIIDTDPSLHVTMLACLAGIANALNRAAYRDIGDSMSFRQVMTGALFAGVIAGPLCVAILSLILQWTSRWLGGVGTYDQVKAAVAWSHAPTAWSLYLWIPQLAIFGETLFKSELATGIGPTKGLVLMVFGIIEVVIGLWQIVIYCKVVGEVNEFSAWRALAATLLAGLVIVGIIGLIFGAIAFVNLDMLQR